MVLVDMLDEVLEAAWRTICSTYNITAGSPTVQVLFEGADLDASTQAAETVIVNMLSEAIEKIDRFSPWYKMPARAFGLIAVRDSTTNCLRWVLAPEAVQRWQQLLGDLTVAIQRNSGLLQATKLVDELVRKAPADDPCVMACCGCVPRRTILVKQSVLLGTEVVCGACKQPFRPVECE